MTKTNKIQNVSARAGHGFYCSKGDVVKRITVYCTGACYTSVRQIQICFQSVAGGCDYIPLYLSAASIALSSEVYALIILLLNPYLMYGLRQAVQRLEIALRGGVMFEGITGVTGRWRDSSCTSSRDWSRAAGKPGRETSTH